MIVSRSALTALHPVLDHASRRRRERDLFAPLLRCSTASLLRSSGLACIISLVEEIRQLLWYCCREGQGACFRKWTPGGSQKMRKSTYQKRTASSVRAVICRPREILLLRSTYRRCEEEGLSRLLRSTRRICEEEGLSLLLRRTPGERERCQSFLLRRTQRHC